jgi:hypothetical protein
MENKHPIQTVRLYLYYVVTPEIEVLSTYEVLELLNELYCPLSGYCAGGLNGIMANAPGAGISNFQHEATKLFF